MILLTIIFYLSSAIVASLLLYPLLAWLHALLFPNPVRKKYDNLQPVSIIIACRNEESCIAQKIESFLDKDEWIEGSELIVISNGSSDGTDAILNRYAGDPRMKVIFESADSSKIMSVNRGVRESQHDLLVFSDCRQTMKKGSVKELVANFSDPQVGTVNSVLIDRKHGRFSFRSFLNFIASCESLSGSSLNVFGALYAQRKEVFREFPVDLLFDDLLWWYLRSNNGTGSSQKLML